MAMALNVEEFVAKTQKLIAKERDAEIAETKILHESVPPKLLERRGVCLLRLKIASRRTGLYGRTILAFEALKEMPSHNLAAGDIVGLSLTADANIGDNIASGIISRVSSSSISIAFDETNENLFELDDSDSYKIVKLANDVTYRRMQRALTDLNVGRGNSQLINVLFGLSDVSLPFTIPDLTYFNENLDNSQKDAVKFSLSQREVAIVHGPPGTGKTTTVTEIIRQAVKSGLKVLACAPSNIAVDNLVEKLSVGGVARIVRLGHPARLLPTIQKHSLDAIVASSDETKLVEDVRSDIDKALGQLKKVRDRGERQRLYIDIKTLRRELRQRESAAVSDILTRASVVLATLTTASSDGPLSCLNQQMFDLVVIDECSQAMEAACWIALLRGNRCILAGDHNQLPPTILSASAAKDGLAFTLMERLLERHKGHDDVIVRMLTTQYRMHDDIMRWSSEQMYQGRLVSHPSVASHLLKDLTGVSDTEETHTALLLIDTAGCNLTELEVADNESKGNEGEADVVTMHVNTLIESGIAAEDIAVIAPYNLQVELLRLRLSQSHPRLEIKSVDGFQGREKEAVILSLVRSNLKGEVGFLAEDRRINVAVTRARRHLAVVCDTETVCRHAFIKSLVDHMTACGEVRSAEQYIQDGALNHNCQTADKLELISRLAPSVNDKRTSSAKKTNKSVSKPVTLSKDSKKLEYNSKPAPVMPKKDDQVTRARFFEILSDFAKDQSRSIHTFPCTITSYDRMLVHEISEQLGLIHISKGELSERYIEVRKTTADVSVNLSSSSPVDELKVSSSKRTQDRQDTLPGQSSVDRTEDKCSGQSSVDPLQQLSTSKRTQDTHPRLPVNSGHDVNHLEQKGLDPSTALHAAVQRCDVCGKQVPVSNWPLHTLRCTVQPAQPTTSQNSEAVKSVISSKKSKKKGGNNVKFLSSAAAVAAADSNDDENFDALLAAAVRSDRTCSALKCKNSTTTLGQTCAFCHLTFCLSHHLAEVHGCGDEARRQARATVAREGKVYPGSGVPSKKPDHIRRTQLESKLNSRLNDLADKRKKKQKENEK